MIELSDAENLREFSMGTWRIRGTQMRGEAIIMASREHLLNTCCLPVTVLGSRVTTVNKTQPLPSVEASLVGDTEIYLDNYIKYDKHYKLKWYLLLNGSYPGCCKVTPEKIRPITWGACAVSQDSKISQIWTGQEVGGREQTVPLGNQWVSWEESTHEK